MRISDLTYLAPIAGGIRLSRQRKFAGKILPTYDVEERYFPVPARRLRGYLENFRYAPITLEYSKILSIVASYPIIRSESFENPWKALSVALLALNYLIACYGLHAMSKKASGFVELMKTGKIKR